MFEKVNPAHPDKLADRIAGAVVDLAYQINKEPHIAVEVLLGHDKCTVMIETDVNIKKSDVRAVVQRIADIYDIKVLIKEQDAALNLNQKNGVRCGDNGIFKGMPLTKEEDFLTSAVAGNIYDTYRTDGKYIYDDNTHELIICQSCATDEELHAAWPKAKTNPLGYWTGGSNVDCGATNRKLGSDMGRSATGGGLHGKDLSKADVSVNIYAWLKAQATGEPVELYCAIGDDKVDDRPYQEIVDIARMYITLIGGFEKFAEWGLIRPDDEWFDELLKKGYLYDYRRIQAS